MGYFWSMWQILQDILQATNSVWEDHHEASEDTDAVSGKSDPGSHSV